MEGGKGKGRVIRQGPTAGEAGDQSDGSEPRPQAPRRL